MGAAEYTKDLQIYLRDEKDKIRLIYLKRPEKNREKMKTKDRHTLYSNVLIIYRYTYLAKRFILYTRELVKLNECC